MNPELRRQIQMQWDIVPMIWVSIVVMLFTAGALHYGIRLPITTALFFMGILWGGYRSFHAVREEILQKTWDWQRLSALSAWTLTWGKLIGCNAFVWYSFAWVVLSGCLIGEQPKALGWIGFYSFFAQAISFLLGLLTVQHATKRWPTILVLFLLFGLMAYGKGLFSLYQAETTFTLMWYGHAYEGNTFILGGLLLYGAWIVQGCYVLMAKALQAPKTVFSWLFFTLFCVLSVLGFEQSGYVGQIYLVGNQIVAGLILLLMLYSLLLIEDMSFVLYKKWFLAYQNADWRGFLLYFPRFLIAWCVFLILGAALCVQENPPQVRWFLAVFLLYVFRDIVLVVGLRLLIKPTQSVMVSLFGLMTVDILLPMMCLLMGYSHWIGGIAPYYSEAYRLEYVASAMIQIISLLGFFIYCFKKRSQQLQEIQ